MLGKISVRTLFIKPGGPWENDYNNCLKGKLREECLNGVIILGLTAARIMVGQGRCHCNTCRPHLSTAGPFADFES